MAAKQTVGMNGMADVFVGSDTHLGLVALLQIVGGDKLIIPFC